MLGRYNSRNLARRDPAAAVLLGAISGADFGYERARQSRARPNHSRRRGNRDPFGRDAPFGEDDDPWAGDAEFGFEPGMNFGADAAAAAAIPKPTANNMQAAWNKQVRQHLANKRRESLLQPNKDAEAKVERYAMPTSQAITIGTALAGFTINANPTVNLRPQRVVSNAPSTNFVFLLTMSVANVNILVGPGVQDAYDYAAESVGTSLDIPTLSPSNPVRITGNYTGFVPASYVVGNASFFTMTFIGWASMVA